MRKMPYRRSQKPDRSGGVRLALLIAMALATLATEVLASNFASQSAELLGQGFPLLNLGTAIITLLLMVFAAAKAAATTYYVRTSGNDGNSGTSPGSAWKTFDEATSSTDEGDIVYFGAGTYTEAVTPSVDGKSGNPIQFIADTDGSMTGDAGSVILLGQDNKGKDANPMVLDKDDYLQFIGIEFIGNSKEGIKVKDCKGFVLRKCEINNSSIGIQIEGDSEVTLTNCLIRDNSNDGILTTASNKNDITIMNCTIANNGEEGIAQEDGDLILTNSIIYGSGKHGINADGADSTTNTYNLLYNNSDGDYNKMGQGTGEILLDPLFESASSYQLQFGSPAIDAGTSSGSPPSDDIEGRSRPADGGYDIGCYEWSLGLVGSWNLDESSGTTAADASDEANDGTVVGTDFAASSENVCATDSTGLRLNGATDYISVANDSSLQFADEMTIMAWIRVDSFGSGSDVDSIVRKGTTNPLDYALVVDDGKVSLVLDDNDSAGFTGDTVLGVDRWYHVAATWDGTEVKIYVNGAQDHSTTHSFSSTLSPDSRDLYIGGHAAGNLFDGTVDDVQIFDNALSASMISDTYGLQVFYKLEEASGTNVVDSSGQGRDGISDGVGHGQTGAVGDAYDFNNDDIDVPYDAVDGLTDISVSFWLKTSQSGKQTILSGANSGENEEFKLYFEKSTEFRVYYNGSHVKWTIDSISDNAWHHFAVVTDDSEDETTLYIDGVTEGTKTHSSSSAISIDSGGLIIGQHQGSVGGGFDGKKDANGDLDEIRIISRPLCAEEVETLHGEGSPGGIRILKWLETQ